ncbi:nucleotidyltransferase family protein [Cyclobacterium sp. 1_MG-2023]|uniref:nucleotidyltransferase family protein n=1 Tax=Cyclobacterium sp. 1_MG-2023 TaxID=3062681 RepID=UPI0026E2E43D|nr:nucleotidyltransferase family protein [Cyclobacterium sp. 1_MG-2023]MDO6436758.1 nucleotidyltransferase family protein [Cyclobacterium sp. 1_MG-2023]
MKIGTIILAAGNSSRLGKPKQLIPYNGISLLQNIVNMALEATNGPVLLVEGAGTYPLRPNPRLKKVVNNKWESGMGSSIKLGLNTLVNQGNITQVLVLLSDQPFVSIELIKSLIRKKIENHTAIVASFYQEAPGVPAIFDQSVFQQLNSIPDEGGAKKLLLSNSKQLSLVRFDEGNIDIDSPEDLEAFKNSDWEYFSK